LVSAQLKELGREERAGGRNIGKFQGKVKTMATWTSGFKRGSFPAKRYDNQEGS
jgi:hypothetical protein